MDFDGNTYFILEPGPAAFYLPAEESTTGVEEELFRLNFPSYDPLNDSGTITLLEHILGKQLMSFDFII